MLCEMCLVKKNFFMFSFCEEFNSVSVFALYMSAITRLRMLERGEAHRAIRTLFTPFFRALSGRGFPALCLYVSLARDRRISAMIKMASHRFDVDSCRVPELRMFSFFCWHLSVFRFFSQLEITGIGETFKTICTGVEMFKKLLDQGQAGDNIGALLRGVKREDVQRGQVLCQPKTVSVHKKFKAEVYVLNKDEGGRHTPFLSNYR